MKKLAWNISVNKLCTIDEYNFLIFFFTNLVLQTFDFRNELKSIGVDVNTTK